MQANHKLIKVVCPVCGITKDLNIPENVFTQKKFGSIKIQIPQMAVCPEHQFIVFVDNKGKIRGYERIDLQMETSSEVTEREEGRITLRNLLKMYGTYGVFSLMHAKIFNFPSYVLIKNESEDLTEDINKIGDSLIPIQYQDTPRINFVLVSKQVKSKLKNKDALIIDENRNILNTPWIEKLKFEEQLIKKTLEIIEEDEQVLLIQQGIAKLIEEAEFTRKLLEDASEIYEDELSERISRELMITKPSLYRISLIKQFIKQRFSEKLASKIKNKTVEFFSNI